jgi:hypothetical protein
VQLSTAQLHPPASSGKEMPGITAFRSPKNGFASSKLQAETDAMSGKQKRSNSKIMFAHDESLDRVTIGIKMSTSRYQYNEILPLKPAPTVVMSLWLIHPFFGQMQI